MVYDPIEAKKQKAEENERKRAKNVTSSDSREEHEEALVALVEHRSREVNNLRHCIFYNNSEVTCFLGCLVSVLAFNHNNN